jgi:hypothetical protein
LIANDGTSHNQDLANIWSSAVTPICGKPVEFSYTEGNGTASSIGSEGQQYASAVLAFRQAGVNHVLVTPDGGNFILLFPPQANSQHYYPRYALTSDNGVGAWNVATPQEQTNAMAVSFNPADIVRNGNASNPDFTQYDRNPQTSNTALCRQIFNGHIPSGEYIQDLHPLCDFYLLLQQALKGATVLTPQNLPQVLLAGMNRVGCGYPAVAAYSSPCFASPDHYDGASAARVMSWQTSNSSWIYVSAPAKVPFGP